MIILEYTDRTKVWGLGAFSPRSANVKERSVISNNTRLPIITTSWSMCHLASIFLPEIKNALRAIKRIITGVNALNLFLIIICFPFCSISNQLIDHEYQNSKR